MTGYLGDDPAREKAGLAFVLGNNRDVVKIMSFALTVRAPAPSPVRRSGNTPIRVWLWVIALFVIGMVVVGGATRLTESGLSITEWKPIHGVVPPLNEAEWLEEFEKYKQIPEYQEINKGMSVEEFKTIYWWEWAHRLLGRVIGFVFLIPFVYFVARGQISRRDAPKLAVLFVLGGLQGAIGWWMVASGLTERTDVSQYRLATHLTLACIILAATVWVAEGFRTKGSPMTESDGLRRSGFVLMLLVLFQIFLGGIVAGLNAGLIYNTWPLMEGQIIPEGMAAMKPLWVNFFENHMTVQFVHRIGAYVLFAIAGLHYLQARRDALDPAVVRRAGLVFLLVCTQAALGIITLIHVVPLHLALAHQAMAAVVLTVAAVHARRLAD